MVVVGRKLTGSLVSNLAVATRVFNVGHHVIGWSRHPAKERVAKFRLATHVSSSPHLSSKTRSDSQNLSVHFESRPSAACGLRNPVCRTVVTSSHFAPAFFV